MLPIEEILTQLGFDDLNVTIIAVTSLLVAFALAILVFISLGYVRSKFKVNSNWYELINIIRQPITYLVLLNGILENLSLFISESFQQWIASVDTLQNLLIIATLLWILIRYIGYIERRIVDRASSDGTVLLPIIKEKVERGTLHLLFKIIRAIIAVIALLMILQAFGVSIAGLLAFGGVGGIVVGFAARDLISNTFSGLRIFWSRPFDVGDWIKCVSQNVEGVVESIGWQITQIRTFDKRPLYVPNSLLADSVIENPQRMTNRRVYEYFGVRYSDIKVVPAILKDVRQLLDEHPHITNDLIRMVNLDRFGAYSVDFFIYCMTATTNWKEYHEVKEDILLKVAEIIHKHDADFAFPTKSVHIDSVVEPWEKGIPPEEKKLN